MNERRMLAVARMLGLLLLGAAGAKLISRHGEIATARFLIPAVYEAALGVWLLGGFLPRWSLRAAAGTFLLFACATLRMIALGESDCGCFGALVVPPWVTYWIDVAALTGIVTALAPPRGPFRRALLLPALLIVSVAVFAAVLGVQRSGASGPIKAGMPWPSDAVDVSDADLRKGRWVLLLYDSSCHRCESLASSYAMEAEGWQDEKSACRLALLDSNEIGEPQGVSSYRNVVRGHLLRGDIHGSSPLLVFLDQGRVLRVSDVWGDREVPGPREVFR